MVGIYLLDVNLLLALAWPAHVNHRDAQEWFYRKRTAGFATCPLTQLSFVRLSSNTRFTEQAAPPMAALALLARITELKEHVFWPDSISCGQAVERGALIVGHKQFTDFYLIALAEANQGILATFDRAVPTGPNVEIL